MGVIAILIKLDSSGGCIFRQRRCIECHSVRGKGGAVGPDLGRRGWVTSFTGVAIAQWRHAEGMRAALASRRIETPTLTSQEMAHVIVYLFSAAYADEPGSPRRGAEIFKEKGCALCHQGGAGPSLDHYRGRATPSTLAQALWMHGPTMLERMRDLVTTENQGVTGLLKRRDYEDTGRILLDTGAIRALPDFDAFTGRSDARHQKHRP